MTIIINVTSGDYTLSLSDRRIVWVSRITPWMTTPSKG
jgi:hypothetical protein